jgi:hypothetical protein
LKITGYMFFVAALFFYMTIWQGIWQLVTESRQAKPDVRLSRFWWLPAWRIHQSSYPTSDVRRRIVMRFTLTFALLIVGMACIARSMLHIA